MNHNHNGASHFKPARFFASFLKCFNYQQAVPTQLSERERAGVATVFWSCISDVRSISTGLQNILKGIYNFTELIRRQVTSLHKGEFAFTAQEIHVLISPQRT